MNSAFEARIPNKAVGSVMGTGGSNIPNVGEVIFFISTLMNERNLVYKDSTYSSGRFEFLFARCRELSIHLMLMNVAAQLIGCISVPVCNK